MSNKSYVCNSLYLKNGYNNINVENDCVSINPQELDNTKHLLHLSDVSDKTNYYVCRGLYDYNKGICETNSTIKQILDTAPVPPSNVPIISDDVNKQSSENSLDGFESPSDGNTWLEMGVGKFCSETEDKNLPLDNTGDLSSNNPEDRYNNTLQQCKAKCAADEFCNFISFTESANGDCLRYNQCPASKNYGDGTKGTVTYMLNQADKNVTKKDENNSGCACGDLLDPVTNLCITTNKPSVDKWMQGQGGWCKNGEIADMVKNGYSPEKSNDVKDWYLACRSTPEEKALCYN